MTGGPEVPAGAVLPRAVRATVGASLGFAVAYALATLAGSRATSASGEVVGFLSRSGAAAAKTFEAVLFYGALVLVPLGAAAAARWRGPVVLPVAASVRKLPDARSVHAWIAATLSITVYTLVVSPRVPSPQPLLSGGLRVLVVLVAAALFSAGLGLLITRLAGTKDAAWRALRWPALLLFARFAPTVPALVFGTLAAAVLGAGASTIASSRRARAAPGGGEPVPARPGRDRWFLAVFLPLLVVTMVYHRDVHGDLDPFHGGEILTPGAMLLDGALPYRDVYLQHGLGQNALRPWLTFLLLGPTYAADRLAQNLSTGIVHAALLVLLLATMRAWPLALGLTLALSTAGLELNPRLTFFLLALAAAALHLRSSRDVDGHATAHPPRRYAFLAGVAAALAALHSVDAGLYATAAVGIFLLLEGFGRGRRSVAPLGSFVLGLIAVAVPAVATLAALGILDAAVANVRDQLALQLPVWGLPFPSPRGLVEVLRRDGPVGLLVNAQFRALLTAATCLIVLAAFAARAGADRLPRASWTLLLLGLGGAALFRSALGRSDAGHFAYASSLLWPTLAVAGEAFFVTRRRRAPFAAALPLVLLCGALVLGFAPLYGLARQWFRLSEAPTRTEGGGFAFSTLPRLEGVLIPESQARALEAIAEYLDRHLPPRAPVLEFSNAGALHFFLDRECPTRFVQPVYAATPRQQRAFIEDVERTRPRFLITCPLLGSGVVDGIPLAERIPLVAEHLAATYAFREATPFGAVFERIDAEASAAEPAGDRVADEPADAR